MREDKVRFFCVIGQDYLHRHRAVEIIKRELLKKSSSLDLITIYPEKIDEKKITEILKSASFTQKIIVFKNPQKLPSSFREFIYKELRKLKNSPYIIFEIEEEYSPFIKKVKKDRFFHYILRRSIIRKTFSSPYFSPLNKFIEACIGRDYNSALKYLEEVFRQDNSVGINILGRLIKNSHFFGEEVLSLLWETDRLIKEKGISPLLALERLVIKLSLKN